MTTRIPTVLELVNIRKESKSVPKKRTDNFKLGLAIEGGSMRGVVAGGMVSALETLGLLNIFDIVYGCSAGAIAGAYFVASQARYGTTIYYENINNNKFINLIRPLVGKPIVSTDFLLDHVCVYEKVLNYDKVINSPIEFVATATSVETAKITQLRNFRTKQHLLTALKASSRIPVVAGEPVDVGGKLYLDGSVAESIPYNSAIEDNCTHIITLLTRPNGSYRSKRGLIEKYVIANKLARFSPDLREAYLARSEEYRKEIDVLFRLSTTPNAPKFLIVQPTSDETIVQSLEKNRAKLVKGATQGYRAVYRALGHFDTTQFMEVIVPTNEIS